MMNGTPITALPLDAEPPAPGDGHWAPVFAGFLGWTLDAFDFFLVVMCQVEIGKTFNATKEQMAFAIAISLFFRPVGALIFGLLADRYGRRLPLMLDLVFYSIVEVASGLAPNYTTFLVLRALFGIGMGGEWGVGASLAMEKVPPKLRGVLSGLLQEGYAMGYLLAAASFGIIAPRWGWRPLFFIGGLPAILALFVRYHIKESEVWERTKSKDWSSLIKAIFANWKPFLYLVALMAAMNFASHGTQDLFPRLLRDDHQFSQHRVSWITVVMQVGAILGGLVFGYLSDRIGRRWAMVLAFVLAILIIPMWAFSHSLVPLVTGAFLIQFMVQGAWGVIPAHINELSPDSVRGFLPGFSYQCGVLIAATVDLIEPILSNRYGLAKAMAIVAAAVFFGAALITALGREKKGVTFGEGQPTPAGGFP
ncbi:MAG TPA: MFS transporter [Tepidisphaeraceae bacterium]|jgi:SHS family lactate transporter-like MFS transporter|nr:MFS transporter [Tepidisphaeraceae bacterium]